MMSSGHHRTPSGEAADTGSAGKDGAAAHRRLSALKARIARIERGGARHWSAVPLGLSPIDGWLPEGGLRQGALHEVMGTADQAASLGFLAGLAARCAAARRGPVLWIVSRPDLYPPGLAAIGLGPDRLILASIPRARGGNAARLWALEEAARTPALGAAVADLEAMDLTAGRRLQLAAEESGVPVLVHHRHAARSRFSGAGSAAAPSSGETGEAAPGDPGDPGSRVPPGAAITRWRVTALPGVAPAQAPDGEDALSADLLPADLLPADLLPADLPGVGDAVWRLELLRARGGQPGAWTIAVDAAGCWRPAPGTRLRPRDPVPVRTAGPVSRLPLPDGRVLAWRRAS